MSSKSKEHILFENHKNPYGLKWEEVKARMKNGETFEEAMNTVIRKRGDKRHNS